MKLIPSQRGISVIELMVSMVLGLLIMATVLTVFLSSKQSYRLDSQMSSEDADGQFVMGYLSNLIRLSGYRSTPTSASSGSYPTLSSVFTSSLPHISGTNGGGFHGSDSITIRFQGSGNGTGTPDGMIRDCLGNSVDASNIATNTISVNNSGELQCRAVNQTTGTDTTQTLIGNVESLQFRYGEDLNQDGVAERYVPANYAGLSMNRVVSVRFSILLMTTDEVKAMTDTNNYNLLGDNYNPADDKRVRRQFEGSVYIRNITSLSTD